MVEVSSDLVLEADEKQLPILVRKVDFMVEPRE
jgi:hypothetical protein